MDAAQIHNYLKSGVEKIFKDMVNMKVSVQGGVDAINLAGKSLSAMSGFAGTYRGLVSIHCSEDFAKRIGSSMLMTDVNSISDEDVKDALGEIANMIGGNFKQSLAGNLNYKEQAFDGALPPVVGGADYESHIDKDAPRFCIGVQAEDATFFVEAVFK